jgi:hypothetical protein
MGKDSWRSRQAEEEREKRKRMHPVWRGVGCIFMGILSLMGYLLADWFVVANATSHWIYMPRELIRPSFAPFLPAGIFVKVAGAIIFLILSYGVLSVIYAIMFPVRPGPTDVPLQRKRPRRRP